MTVKFGYILRSLIIPNFGLFQKEKKNYASTILTLFSMNEGSTARTTIDSTKRIKSKATNKNVSLIIVAIGGRCL